MSDALSRSSLSLLLKKKTPAQVDRGKGMDLLSDVALLEAAQLKKTLKKTKDKTTGTVEGIGTKPGVPDVPKYLSESENEFWGDSADDDSNDDDSDEVTKDDDDDDDDDSDANGDKEASDSEKTDSDEDENPNLNQNDDEEEEYEEEYVRTLDSIEFIKYDEEYEELYKDVNKTEVPLQSSSVSSDIANQFLNLDNVPPTDTEVISMMNVKVRHEEPSTQTPPLLNIPVMATPTLTPSPTTVTTITSIPDLPDFSSLLEDSIKKAFMSYTAEFKKKAKDKRKRYIDLVEKSVKDIIKDEVKSQLPHHTNKEVSGTMPTPCGSNAPLLGSSYDIHLVHCRQVVPANYFINNDLEYLKGGSLSRKYTTFITKIKAAKYDAIEGIEDMVPSLWSPVKGVQLYKFKEGDFSRLNLCDIKDMLLLLVQKKLFNMERDVIYDLNVALRMFTRRVVILKLVEDLQLGVKSNQKKLNITKPKTFRSVITNLTSYAAYNNLQGIIYLDKFKRNKLMRSDELYKFCDGTLTSV
ncbi:hypothetical protein Tco_1484992 [Tanacetum coccineum]